MNIERVRDWLRDRAEAEALPSVAVAVAFRGRILWEEAFGWADRERSELATSHTLYSVASVTKPMTATGIMVLRQWGLLDLDRPVNDYLGPDRVRARVGDVAAATVRRVLNHTAGLPLHYRFFYEDEQERVPAFQETLKRYAQLLTAPGERFLYSNMGYGVLGHMISALTHRSYADFMRREVFGPLGMRDTFVHTAVTRRGSAPFGEPPPTRRVGARGTWAVRYSPEGHRYPWYDCDHPGGSSVWSSVHDLVRFGMFHVLRGTSLLPARAVEEMQTGPNGRDVNSGYGLGWRLSRDVAGSLSIGHAGSMGGVSAALHLSPVHELVVAVLINTESSLANEVAGHVREGLGLPPLDTSARGKVEEDNSWPLGLSGQWQGRVDDGVGDVKIRCWIAGPDTAFISLGSQTPEPLRDLKIRASQLRARFSGHLAASGARHPYDLHLDLKWRQVQGGTPTLSGAVMAVTRSTGRMVKADQATAPPSQPGWRVGDALSYWVELDKVAPSEDEQIDGHHNPKQEGEGND